LNFSTFYREEKIAHPERLAKLVQLNVHPTEGPALEGQVPSPKKRLLWALALPGPLVDLPKDFGFWGA
jgi:hypothetical protein